MKKIGIGTRCLFLTTGINDTDKNVSDSLIVNSVGDGNCIFISNPKSQKSAMLDFGGTKLASFEKDQLDFANIFILSHYHKDHYSRLFTIKPKNDEGGLQIEKLYFPVLPQISGEDRLLQKILLFFDCIIGEISGSPEVDLIKLISSLNKNR